MLFEKVTSSMISSPCLKSPVSFDPYLAFLAHPSKCTLYIYKVLRSPSTKIESEVSNCQLRWCSLLKIEKKSFKNYLKPLQNGISFWWNDLWVNLNQNLSGILVMTSSPTPPKMAVITDNRKKWY